ncbi:inositol-pentakisphosphate 2-kinase isoform X1 [Manduca sexta]|uniref:inositol-pentakisphosphate 2-kinase isoform X1 n=1 Tax=Manduca sexta TaxID=7130 RepID=UPI00188FE0CF|nr:inositol-pentakisphosphate 2-kinase isoform X1 [Manduca sexta]
MELLGKKWKYINEGNVHIVLQLLETDYVLRLIKEDRPSMDFTHMKICVDFVNKVMNPLLQNNNTEEETVQLPSNILHDLSRLLHDLRPQNRIFKSVISPHAIKAPNLTIVSSMFKSNYCVEIKPKEGYMCRSLQPYSKCYFCLKQYTKLQLKQIQSVSNYCPLDLFSGIRSRMNHAIKCLADNPQNNFKLFKNGTLVYDEKSKREYLDCIIKSIGVFDTTDMFIDYIVDILLGNSCESTLVHESKDRIPGECDVTNILGSSSFLYNLLQIQKLTESIIMNEMKETNSDYVPIILKKLESEKLDLQKQNDRDRFFKVLKPLHTALISAVAKDCSIMISFSPEFDECYPFIQVNNTKITYKVSVTDLEPKSLKSVLKRMENEKEMIEIYKEYFGKKQ